MAVKAVKTVEEFQTVINAKEICVIDFYADWCGPCRLIAPVLDRISQTITSIKFYKVNIDNVPNAAVDVHSVPTFRFYAAGEKVDEFVGADEASLKSKIFSYAGQTTRGSL
uniref:Thioredoxin n=1 Tax=Spongospora subterranea TaxID=70186 RepID=A0A0H5RAR9_9EUKA|eukprot:CRZ11158.1 hypothetical protein [Spongospora subterranea]